MIFITILFTKILMLNCYLLTQTVLLMKYENVYEELFKWKDLFDLDLFILVIIPKIQSFLMRLIKKLLAKGKMNLVELL